MRSPASQLDSRRRRRKIRAVPADLVLASASPRRRELLRWLGVQFRVDAVDVDERPRAGEAADAIVHRLARTKAEAGAARAPGSWILAADTLVELDGAVLGKPRDRDDAVSMLTRLSGREHRVYTGFALRDPAAVVRAARVVTSRVRFRSLGRATIEAYASCGEPDDKAGAYALQGRGAGLVAEVVGSFTNVIGLPLVEVEAALTEAGVLAR